jgi:hypothetical protein
MQVASARSVINKPAAIRCFALLIICVAVIDVLPRSWNWLAVPKQYLTAVLNRVGLWQGEWPMFAPDPIINNGWFTAEIHAIDGSVTQWDSPYWYLQSGWDKFVRFRHMDFFNRLPLLHNRPAAEDFADYLGRQAVKPAAAVKLYRNQLSIQMPSDGTIPSRDEIVWLFNSEPVAIRNYQP